jgi:hypothetical protein
MEMSLYPSNIKQQKHQIEGLDVTAAMQYNTTKAEQNDLLLSSRNHIKSNHSVRLS